MNNVSRSSNKKYSTPLIYQNVNTTKTIPVPANKVLLIKQIKPKNIYTQPNQAPITNPTNNRTYICNLHYKTGSKQQNNLANKTSTVPFQINFTNKNSVSIAINLVTSAITVNCSIHMSKYASSLLQCKAPSIINTLAKIKAQNNAVKDILNGKTTMYLFGKAYPVVITNGPLNVAFANSQLSITYNNSCSYFSIAYAIKQAYSKMLNKYYVRPAKSQIKTIKRTSYFNIVIENSGAKLFKTQSSKNNHILCLSSVHAICPTLFINHSLLSGICNALYPTILPINMQIKLKKHAKTAFAPLKKLLNTTQFQQTMQTFSGLYAI